jgi:hypothetical protein
LREGIGIKNPRPCSFMQMASEWLSASKIKFSALRIPFSFAARIILPANGEYEIAE